MAATSGWDYIGTFVRAPNRMVFYISRDFWTKIGWSYQVQD